MNLYFLRSAKDKITKEDRSEGTEYMLPSLMASEIYLDQHCSLPTDKLDRCTCLPAVLSIAVLSIFLKSSSVFTLRMMPSARAVPKGALVRRSAPTLSTSSPAISRGRTDD